MHDPSKSDSSTMKLTSRGRNHDGRQLHLGSATDGSSPHGGLSPSPSSRRRHQHREPSSSLSSSSPSSTPLDPACCRNHDDNDGVNVVEDDDSGSGRHFHRKVVRKYPPSPCSRVMIVTVIRHVHHRWRLMTVRSKLIFSLITAIITLRVMVGLWDQCYYQIGDTALPGTQHQYHDDDNQSNNNNHNDNNNKGLSASSIPLSEPPTTFAVVINTYKRPERLRRAVRHYADTCGRAYGVGQVFIVWAEQGVDPPDPSSFWSRPTLMRASPNRMAGGSSTTTATTRRVGNRSDVQVLKKDRDSLNSRFEPIDALQTTAVFMVDDDIRVSCSSLLLAFRAWQAHPDTMVGYYPRLASRRRSAQSGRPDNDDDDERADLVYHAWPIVYWRHTLNFVLTKASFLHSKYLALYTSPTDFPQAIKDHVDLHKNCEDIAMSMLVANYTRYQASISSSVSSSPPMPARPIYVEGRVSDQGLFGGISTGTGHMATRSDCLTELTKIFLTKGWDPPLDYEYSLDGSAWIHHAPGYWWQYEPSNFFEWFALGSAFT